MSEAEKLAARLDALETRIAYQDQVIEDLNTTITAQWKAIDRLTRETVRLSERVQETEDAGFTGAAEPPPPHY